MSFTVTAGAAPRVYSWQHGSMLSALEQSLSLATSGMTDVRITDGEGRAYSPSALYHVMFGQPATPREDQLAPREAQSATREAPRARAA